MLFILNIGQPRTGDIWTSNLVSGAFRENIGNPTVDLRTRSQGLGEKPSYFPSCLMFNINNSGNETNFVTTVKTE